MPILVAILLGVVQGLTEFIPISSSGHLVAVPWALGVEEPTLSFAVALHVGTLAGVVAALLPELKVVLRTVTRWSTASDSERLLIKLLLLGSIPAGIVGLVASATIGDQLDRPVMVGFLLLVTGYLLTTTETRLAHEQREPTRTEITTPDALRIGVAQAFAILPGISRSGATIVAGMRGGVSREAAARFSFLLSVPAIAGAAVVEMPDAFGNGAFAEDAIPLIAGMAAAALSGWWALRWFLGIVTRTGLRPFGRYCWLAGVFVLLLATARA